MIFWGVPESVGSQLNEWSKLSNLWWIPNSVSRGFSPAMSCHENWHSSYIGKNSHQKFCWWTNPVWNLVLVVGLCGCFYCCKCWRKKEDENGGTGGKDVEAARSSHLTHGLPLHLVQPLIKQVTLSPSFKYFMIRKTKSRVASLAYLSVSVKNKNQ